MLGGALFMTSDALLATNRFAVALPAANLWILGHLLGGAMVHRVVAETTRRRRAARLSRGLS